MVAHRIRLAAPVLVLAAACTSVPPYNPAPFFGTDGGASLADGASPSDAVTETTASDVKLVPDVGVGKPCKAGDPPGCSSTMSAVVSCDPATGKYAAKACKPTICQYTASGGQCTPEPAQDADAGQDGEPVGDTVGSDVPTAETQPTDISIGPAPDAKDAADAGAPSNLLVAGPVTAGPGKTVPASAKVLVIWSVSSGSPDYVAMWGQGSLSGGSFSVSLSGPPPEACLNSGTLGVAYVLVVPAGVEVATGKLTEADWKQIEAIAIGGASNHVIVYRKPGAEIPKSGWWDGFSGYGCGKGVPGSPFDNVVPVSCKSLGVTIDDFEHIVFVNWT